MIEVGFEVPETTLQLSFTDPSYAGLEVACRMAPRGVLTAAASLGGVDPRRFTREHAATLDHLSDAFAESLLSWNLTRNGVDVPATKEGVDSLDLAFLMQLVTPWLEGTGQALAQQAAEQAAHSVSPEEEAEIEASMDVRPLG